MNAVYASNLKKIAHNFISVSPKFLEEWLFCNYQNMIYHLILLSTKYY